MPKTEVYSWRVSPAVKSRLEEAARRRGQGVAALLDEIVKEHLDAAAGPDADDDRQRRLHADVARLAGCVAGSDPRRSAGARERVRARLRARRGHGR
jgi:hypothetical protein